MTLSTEKKRVNFIMKIGSALHLYGIPAQRLEQALSKISESLDIRANFFSTPTSIMASFHIGENETEEDLTRIIRVQPGEIDLEKMSLLDEVGDAVIRGELDVDQGSKRIDEITLSSSRYPAWITLLSFAWVSGAASSFFGADWMGIGLSALLGLGMGALALLGGAWPNFGKIFEGVAAFGAASLALGLGQIFPEVSTSVVTLSSLIVFVPGLTLTTAMAELATQNLVSGTARLMGAGITFLKLGFGVALALKLGSLLNFTSSTGVPGNLPFWVDLLAVWITPLAFLVLFRAQPKDAGWILISGVLGVNCARLGAEFLGGELGVFLGGLIVSIASNLFARLKNRPASIMLVPGIILLVPGSFGFRSFSFLFENDVFSGIDMAFKMLVISVALVAGLLFANFAVPPKRSL